jgi:hypothetical protein
MFDGAQGTAMDLAFSDAPGKLFTDSTSHAGSRDPLDEFAPRDQPFGVDVSTPQGQAWLEAGRAARDAWKNPDAARSASFAFAPPGASPSGAQFSGPRDTAGSPRAGSGYSDVASGSRASYAPPPVGNCMPSFAERVEATAEAARAAAERDRAREEWGRIQRDAWRHP